jgi:hypothetical protein
MLRFRIALGRFIFLDVELEVERILHPENRDHNGRVARPQILHYSRGQAPLKPPEIIQS